MPMPNKPKIYHIVHVDKLASIIADGCLWCDSEVIRRNPGGTTIGMSGIKKRRLEELEVGCHPGDKVGEYVPFYFCPRSIMLYVIYMANHPELDYRGGQGPIVHLELDLCDVIDWADSESRRWAFSLSNAGARYTEFRTGKGQLAQLDWDAIESTSFKDPDIKERKQAEFLLSHSLPWELVARVGVSSPQVYAEVLKLLQGVAHRPAVEVKREWYF